MSDDSRVRELQGALREKMADNKTIADSFRVDNGTVVVSAEQKSAFDKNMGDIREIKSLIEGLESMKGVQEWGSQQSSDSVAAAAAAGAFSAQTERHMSIGDAFVNSAEFKSLQGGKNGANMPSAFQMNTSLTGYNVKDVYSALP